MFDEAEMFSGDENSFVLRRTYDLKFHCDFDLHRFPFDMQSCPIKIDKPAEYGGKVNVTGRKYLFPPKDSYLTLLI